MFTLAARLALGIALLGIWLSASAGTSYACSCLPPGSPTEALDYSDAVFRGRATSAHVDETTRIITTEFDVSVVWKGPLNRTISITTGMDGVSCGIGGFSLGAEYIVYSYGGSTGICGRTHNLAMGFPDDDYNDMEELGQGQAPTDAIPAPTVAAENQTAGGCGLAADSGADVWWAALAVGVAWLGRRGTNPR